MYAPRKIVGVTLVAAVIGVAALLAACAGPSTRTADKTAKPAEMAKFEAATSQRECYWQPSKFSYLRCKAP